MGAIHFAAERGSRVAVQALLNAGARLDSRNPVEQTALQCAGRNDVEDVVKLLLENNANVDAKDNAQTALHGAAGQGNESIVKLLLDFNADVNAEDLDGQTANQFAGRRHHDAVVDLLAGDGFKQPLTDESLRFLNLEAFCASAALVLDARNRPASLT